MIPRPIGWLSLAALFAAVQVLEVRAQETNNAPHTEIELLEAQTGTVIFKGYALAGTVNARSGQVAVKCKETTDAITGRKLLGLAITVTINEQQSDTTVIDYEELDSMQDALDRIAKADWSITSLASFEALYTTKGGLRVATYSNKRQGTIQAFVESAHIAPLRVGLSLQEFSQFKALIQQARSVLDGIRSKGAPQQ